MDSKACKYNYEFLSKIKCILFWGEITMLKTRVSLLAGVALILEGCVGVGPSSREENVFTKCDSMVREAALRDTPKALKLDFLLTKIPSPVKDSVDWDNFLKELNGIILPGNDEKKNILKERIAKCYAEAKKVGDEDYDMYIKEVLYPRIEESCKINVELPFNKNSESMYVVAGQYLKNINENPPRYASYGTGNGSYCFISRGNLRGHIKFDVIIKSKCDIIHTGTALALFVKEGSNWVRKEQVLQSLYKSGENSYSGLISNVTISPIDDTWTAGNIEIVAQLYPESILMDKKMTGYIPADTPLRLDLGPDSTPHRSSKSKVYLLKRSDDDLLKEIDDVEAGKLLEKDPLLKNKLFCEKK
ncbi:MAG: hypothetical protein HQL81_04470 [Magnetococcales bacterium]|nr:hypothetical protein [Magnetococcales bacterium]